jgi:DNA (cytosine-5)-methyltransferase 1
LASAFGVPQNRKRIIIIGTRNDIKSEPSFPTPLLSQDKYLNLRDAIYDLPLDYSNEILNHKGNSHKVIINQYVGNRHLDWDKPSPTITGRGSRSGGAVIHPHPNQHRRLSVRECARIQTFPDDFHFVGSNGACYSQIGNAVPPIMSFFIANQFRLVFNKRPLSFSSIEWKLPYFNKLDMLLRGCCA